MTGRETSFVNQQEFWLIRSSVSEATVDLRGGALVGQQNMAKVKPGVTAAQEVKGGFLILLQQKQISGASDGLRA